MLKILLVTMMLLVSSSVISLNAQSISGGTMIEEIDSEICQVYSYSYDSSLQVPITLDPSIEETLQTCFNTTNNKSKIYRHYILIIQVLQCQH